MSVAALSAAPGGACVASLLPSACTSSSGVSSPNSISACADGATESDSSSISSSSCGTSGGGATTGGAAGVATAAAAGVANPAKTGAATAVGTTGSSPRRSFCFTRANQLGLGASAAAGGATEGLATAGAAASRLASTGLRQKASRAVPRANFATIPPTPCSLPDYANTAAKAESAS